MPSPWKTIGFSNRIERSERKKFINFSTTAGTFLYNIILYAQR